MLPSILAKQLQKGIGDYIETTFPMTNEPFKGSVQKMLATKGSVYHEPYVAVRLPFRVAEEMPTCFEAIHPAYRTTEEIRKHAFALLNGISFDDLDEGVDIGDKCQSLTHGEKPIIENFSNANDEFDFILSEVKKLKNNGVALTDICVVARTKKLVDDYIALFTGAGIRTYAIKRNKVDDRSFDGLRVATMHRVKGLEFKYVFIAAVNNRIIPLPSAINKTDPVSEAESITSEKCLFYVAMTRAQKGVYITSYGKESDFLKP